MKKIIALALCSIILNAEAPTYTIKVHGKPFLKGINFTEKYAKEKGINIKYIFLGCKVTEKQELNGSEDKNNKEANKYYENRLGKNWLKNMQNEAKKAMNNVIFRNR